MVCVYVHVCVCLKCYTFSDICALEHHYLLCAVVHPMDRGQEMQRGRERKEIRRVMRRRVKRN